MLWTHLSELLERVLAVQTWGNGRRVGVSPFPDVYSQTSWTGGLLINEEATGGREKRGQSRGHVIGSYKQMMEAEEWLGTSRDRQR